MMVPLPLAAPLYALQAIQSVPFAELLHYTISSIRRELLRVHMHMHLARIGDPEGVFRQILCKPAFQLRFLPVELRKGLSATAMRDKLLDTPMIVSFVEVFHLLRGFRAKRKHLSLFAPHFPYGRLVHKACPLRARLLPCVESTASEETSLPRVAAWGEPLRP